MRMQPTFGETLRELRELAGFTQAELGTRLHMTQRKISYLETDKCEPSLSDLRALCSFFHISADYFLSLPNDLEFPTETTITRYKKSHEI